MNLTNYKSKMINIFIGLSQSQINNHSLVIKQLKLEHETNVLLSSKDLSYNTKLFSEVHSYDGNFDNKSTNLFEELNNITKKIKNYKKLIRKIKHYKDETNIQLFFSYVEDILSNHLLLSFNKNITGIVVEDGVLNYYNHTLNNISSLKFSIKYLVSNILGLRFKKYKGHSSGVNFSKVTTQFVKHPTLSVCPEKSKQLVSPSKSIQEFSNSLLIIGQEPLEKIIGNTLYYNALTTIFDNVKQLMELKKIETIYYKPHRNGSPIKTDFIKKYFNENEITIVKSNETIEDFYFKQLKSKYIFSFNSSATLNIYTILNHNERKNLLFTVYLDKSDTLVTLFKSFGFNVVFFDN